ncbi:hypothetical protein BGX34_005053, partial [Mortierella sp. NVP85]
MHHLHTIVRHQGRSYPFVLTCSGELTIREMKHLILQRSLEANPGILLNHYIKHVSLPKRGVEALLRDGDLVRHVLAANDLIYADTAAESAGRVSGDRIAKITDDRKASSPDGRKASSLYGRKASSPDVRKAEAARKERVRDVQGARTSDGSGVTQQQPAERTKMSHQEDHSRPAVNTHVRRPPQLVTTAELMKPWNQEIELAKAIYETSNDR